jgi:fatty acid-binding protein DegV
VVGESDVNGTAARAEALVTARVMVVDSTSANRASPSQVAQTKNLAAQGVGVHHPEHASSTMLWSATA